MTPRELAFELMIMGNRAEYILSEQGDILREAATKLEQMEVALRFYADVNNYNHNVCGSVKGYTSMNHRNIAKDKGKTAREALNGK